MSNKFKSLGVFIFGGSQSIGHLNAGWNVDRILEMTDDMKYNNSYHFIKNHPEIPVVDYSKWNNSEYINSLKSENYDLLFANNPCSGLSRINRNANINQPINKRFFEVFNLIHELKPKTFLIENAPTLISTGLGILKKMVDYLHNDYKFTIIRDRAGNHEVPMVRTRTMIVGWRKDIFNNRCVIVEPKHEPICTVAKVFENLNESLPNMTSEKTEWDNLIDYYSQISQNESVLRFACNNFSKVKDLLTTSQLNNVVKSKVKLESGGNIWDKSPWRLDNDKQCMSLTSISRFIHPTEHRNLTIREYARLMGYPDDFIFYPEECKCSTIQCIAQGVPVSFIKWISLQIIDALENHYNYYIDENVSIIYQNLITNKYYLFNDEEFLNATNISDGMNLENNKVINNTQLTIFN